MGRMEPERSCLSIPLAAAAYRSYCTPTRCHAGSGDPLTELFLSFHATQCDSTVGCIDAHNFDFLLSDLYFPGGASQSRYFHSRADRCSCVQRSQPWSGPGQSSSSAGEISYLFEVVRYVIPNIKEVSVRAIDGTRVQVRVSNNDPHTSHERHMLPLSEGGTGVGQVLAILYVVLTSNEGRVIAIDEPNSFLHPGAARRLMEVLKEHPEHQFIIGDSLAGDHQRRRAEHGLFSEMGRRSLRSRVPEPHRNPRYSPNP